MIWFINIHKKTTFTSPICFLSFLFFDSAMTRMLPAWYATMLIFSILKTKHFITSMNVFLLIGEMPVFFYRRWSNSMFAKICHMYWSKTVILVQFAVVAWGLTVPFLMIQALCPSGLIWKDTWRDTCSWLRCRHIYCTFFFRYIWVNPLLPR